jgi:hypothetical protein
LRISFKQEFQEQVMVNGERKEKEERRVTQDLEGTPGSLEFPAVMAFWAQWDHQDLRLYLVLIYCVQNYDLKV